MKSILVPTDFSNEANFALDFAKQWAKKGNGSIHLLHVIELPSSSFSVTGDGYSQYDAFDNVFATELINKTKTMLSELAEGVKTEGIEVETSLKMGNTYSHIYNRIVEEDHDLVIMGSKGATGLKEMFVGSNTEKVIRHSEVPVITIKEPTNLDGIKNMVYATDFSHNKSIELARAIQNLLGINIHLLKVYNSNRIAYTSESARTELYKFAKEEELNDFTINVIDAPFVEDGILEFANDINADIIFMGTHGYTGIPHFLWGSRAESVANHSKKPVITVKV